MFFSFKTFRLLVLCAAFLALACPVIAAEVKTPAPAPAPAPAADAITTPTKAPVVVELFSSQACAFCPRADALLADLVQSPHVIGLACHIDYFDVKEGSLAQSFCTDRQKRYESQLRAGPSYTPQMVIDGRYDVVGYRFNDVRDTLANIEAPLKTISITKADKPDTFELGLDEEDLKDAVQIYILFFDKPHTLKIKDGTNRGKEMTYVNIVSRMKELMKWDGTAQDVQIEATLKDSNQGFVVLAQDPKSGRIISAGQYKIN